MKDDTLRKKLEVIFAVQFRVFNNKDWRVIEGEYDYSEEFSKIINQILDLIHSQRKEAVEEFAARIRQHKENSG